MRRSPATTSETALQQPDRRARVPAPAATPPSKAGACTPNRWARTSACTRRPRLFGYLQNELWRAIRLVTDTGLAQQGLDPRAGIIHARQPAASETDATAEAERYIAWPLAGDGGVQDRRVEDPGEEEGAGAAGDKFDLREFHAEILKDGALPLSVLEDKVDPKAGWRRSSSKPPFRRFNRRAFVRNKHLLHSIHCLTHCFICSYADVATTKS